MKFVKKYQTKNDALSDGNLTSPFVTRCDSNSQMTIQGGFDEPFKLVENGQGQLVPETKETYMYFEALQAGSTVYLFHRDSPTEDHNIDLHYSTDNCQSWSEYTIPNPGQSGEAIELSNVGDRVYFKGDNPNGFNFIYYNGKTFTNKYANYFLGSGHLKVAGSIMSLIYDDNFKGQRTLSCVGNFGRLFQGNTVLIDASDFILPVKDISNDESTYVCMFYGCSNLTSAPALPATTLSISCYSNMFYNCSSLTSAPALPATTLAQSCYQSMFLGCSSLTSAPELPASVVAKWCYKQMFNKCAGLTSAPAILPAITLAGSCYFSMFTGCSSLTSAPALPATTLADSCYFSMFDGCSRLTSAPELPATTLPSYCYNYMFNKCSKLSSVTCLATDFSASGCTTNWLSGVSSTGTFTKNSAMSSWTTGTSGIPSGWTVQDAA